MSNISTEGCALIGLAIDKTPLIVTLCLLAVGIVGMLSIRLSYYLENQNRIQKAALSDITEIEAENRSTKHRGDQRFTFIYGY